MNNLTWRRNGGTSFDYAGNGRLLALAVVPLFFSPSDLVRTVVNKLRPADTKDGKHFIRLIGGPTLTRVTPRARRN